MKAFASSIISSGAALCLIFAMPIPIRAQEMPSRSEIDELASKADQKLDALETALKAARADIQRNAPALWNDQLDSISTTRMLLKVLKEQGPSAYRLVALVTTLDDVSRASLRSVIVIVSGKPLDDGSLARLAAIASAELGCHDISELLFHATLRLIEAEEDIIQGLPAK